MEAHAWPEAWKVVVPDWKRKGNKQSGEMSMKGSHALECWVQIVGKVVAQRALKWSDPILLWRGEGSAGR